MTVEELIEQEKLLLLQPGESKICSGKTTTLGSSQHFYFFRMSTTAQLSFESKLLEG